MQNKIILSECEKNEINTLREILQSHIREYGCFKSFCKTAKNALLIAHSLLNNDYATFKKFKLIYTTHTAEKMRGIMSLSTYKKTSQICQYLSSCGGICAKCYADKSLTFYRASLIPVLIYNTLLLKYIEIDNAQINYINEKYFRFESFSDLQGAQHFYNLIKICKKNKETIFTLWTKAGANQLYKFMQKTNIKKLPINFNIVNSEFYINECKYTADDLVKMQSILNTKNALKNFIVYDNDEKRAASGFYQCKNKCVNCLKCYKRAKKPVFIAEKLH